MGYSEIKCRICGNPEVEFIFSESKNGTDYTSYKCGKCDLFQTLGYLEPISPDYIDLDDTDLVEEHIYTQTENKSKAFRQWIRLVSKYYNQVERLKLLDIGCGVGGFLDYAATNGIQSYGFDASLSQVNHAKANHGDRVLCCYSPNEFLQEKPSLAGQIDLVTMWDVFEHIRNPIQVLSEAKNLMRENGLMFVSVPNGAVNPIKVWISNVRRKQPGLIPWEHVLYYTTRSLRLVVEQSGYSVIAVGGVTPYRRSSGGVHELARRLIQSALINSRYAFQIYALATIKR